MGEVVCKCGIKRESGFLYYVDKSVGVKEGAALAAEYHTEFMEASAKENINVDELIGKENNTDDKCREVFGFCMFM